MVVAPVVAPVMIAVAPYAEAVELASGRLAYRAAEYVARKAATELAYVYGFGKTVESAVRTVKEGVCEIGYEGVLRSVELMSRVVPVQTQIKMINISTDITKGLYMPDAPVTKWEYRAATADAIRGLWDNGYLDNTIGAITTISNQPAGDSLITQRGQ